MKCYSCKKEGHISKYCTQKSKPKIIKKKYQDEKSSYATLLFSSSSLIATNNSKSEDWFVDSGATSHMTNTKDILHNLKQINGKHVIVANNNKMSIQGAGDVSVVLNSGKNITNAVLRDVEYVPEMAVNLLSVQQMTLKGNKEIFEGNSCKIFNKSGKL